MSNAKDSVRIDLTPEQKDAVRSATGKDAEAVELSVEELEARIAPMSLKQDLVKVLHHPRPSLKRALS